MDIFLVGHNLQRCSPSHPLGPNLKKKKRWQEYTELYQKGLNDPDNHDGVVTYLGQTSWNMKSSGP